MESSVCVSAPPTTRVVVMFLTTYLQRFANDGSALCKLLSVPVAYYLGGISDLLHSRK